MDYKSIIESRYNRENWQRLLFDIFGNRVEFWSQPQSVPVDANMAKSACYMGKITLPDKYVIAIYEVALSESVVIERNRAGIRNLLCSSWRSMGCAGAFMFCYRDSEAVLRFSYVSESFAFAEDGTMVKEKTDTKRFTYLLGEGHRSRTAIKQFEDLKKSALDLKAITKAFSVEALSDQFFKEYKKQYENIIALITGKRMVKVANKWEEQPDELIPAQDKATFGAAIMQEFNQFANPEKAVRDYVKKLMGRLVFIQFLQKKGWMGCSVGDAWNDGDKEFIQNLFAKSAYKDTFVDDVLEPLFNDINTRRQGDICSSSAVGLNIKVPYLNGGLFEKDDYDKTAFPLPAKYMKDMLDFFASYNFTIDENDPDDAEIGVDPEMLGRIFENLLEDNKDKGAFYTPKEIVQYMCRESLIAYLQTDIEDKDVKESIRQFVTAHDVSVLAVGYEDTIDQKLKDVKICDPAIGSGAFPMGLLRELYACRKSIEGIDDDTAVSIKTHIIQNNIYGVDIEKGAVDIARLRFWLALIVDEKTPHALPNMDFKIMQGNSLLEEYKGVNLSGLGKGNILGTKSLSKKKGSDFSQQTSLAIDCETSIDNITKDLKTYFSTSDHAQKQVMLEAINRNVHDFIRHAVNERADIMEELDSIKLENDQFFLWHTWFKDVFDKGGFDIVIGNPPYIDSETMVKKMPETRDLYAKKYETASGNWDMFIIFIEFGIKLINQSGIFCNIIPNKLIAAKYAVELRNFIARRNIIEVRDYSRIDVFTNAAVYPITILLRNGKTIENSTFTIMKDIISIKQNNITSPKELTNTEYWDVFFTETPIYNLIAKINSYPRLRSLQLDVLGAATVADAYEIKNIVKEHEDHEQGLKLINSGTIDPYYSLWGTKLCRYIKSSYSRPIVPADALKQYNENRYNQSKSPKIIVASMSTRYEAFFDTLGEYIAGKSTTILLGDINVLYFLTAIINSKLASYWLNIEFNSLKMSGGAINVGKNELLILPIPTKMHDFRNIVDQILSAKKSNPNADTSALESQIDELVYDLYGLSEDEKQIVRNA